MSGIMKASHAMDLRQQAIQLKQAGWSVSLICQHLERSRDWFYKWWHRYQAEGVAGLRAHSSAPKTQPTAWSAALRQTIIHIRDDLMRRYGAGKRYRWAGAPTIRHELEGLGYTAVPSLRSIERMLHAAGRTSPTFRTQTCIGTRTYPGPRATRSNQLHQMDLIGPRYLKGSRRPWFFLVYCDAYDHAVYVEFQPKPHMDAVLAFVVRAWQHLGLPRQLQVDNSDLFGLTSHPGALNRFIRLALRVGVELVFIPQHEPWRNGAIEHFNGWLQDRLLALCLRSPTQVRRELAALMHCCFYEHIHPQLGFQTTAQTRQHLSKRTLPYNFRLHLQPLPIAKGRIAFIRRVQPSGHITVLGVRIRAGKRFAHQYVLARLYTRTMTLHILFHGQIVKRLPFPFVGKSFL